MTETSIRSATHRLPLWSALTPLWDMDASGWFVLDGDGRLVYANEALKRLVNAELTIGSRATPVEVIPEYRRNLERVFAAHRAGARSTVSVLHVPAVVGTRLIVLWMALLGLPGGSPDHRAVTGVVRPLDKPVEDGDGSMLTLPRMVELEHTLARIHREVAAVMPTDAGSVVPADLQFLSPRQRVVASLLASGMTSSKIADRLCLSLHTVRSHTKVIYRKLGVHSQAELAAHIGKTDIQRPI